MERETIPERRRKMDGELEKLWKAVSFLTAVLVGEEITQDGGLRNDVQKLREGSRTNRRLLYIAISTLLLNMILRALKLA